MISFGKMRLPDVANLLTEKMFNSFSEKPALKLGQQFTGTAAETTSHIFPVKRRERCCFSGWAPLTPLFLRLNAVNAVVFPVERCYSRYFFG